NPPAPPPPGGTHPRPVLFFGGPPAEGGFWVSFFLLFGFSPRGFFPPRVRGWMIFLSVVGIIYGALVSLMQKDMKKLVAYSSVSHLGFCTLGIFALNPA